MPRRALLFVLLALIATSVGRSATSHAWTAQVTNPLTRVTAATLPNATSAAATTTTTTCSSVSLTWAAAGAGVTGYRVERRVNAGAWTSIAPNVATTSYVDNTGFANQLVEYRVISRGATNWEGTVPAQSALLRCGVTDLAVTNPCSESRLTWSPSAAATTYDVHRQVNGGGFTVVAPDIAATSWTDPALHPAGATVEYQVRPGIGAAGDATWSATTAFPNWQPFRVTSVTATGGTVPGTIGAGDTLVVQFSKPVNTASLADTALLTAQKTGAASGRGLYITGGANPGLIGSVNGSLFGANAAPTGTSAFSNGGLTWTWSWSGGTSTTQDLPLSSGTWAAGTGIRCTDATTLHAAPAPTLGGSF